MGICRGKHDRLLSLAWLNVEEARSDLVYWHLALSHVVYFSLIVMVTAVIDLLSEGRAIFFPELLIK